MPEGWGNCQNEDSMGEEQNRFIKVKSREKLHCLLYTYKIIIGDWVQSVKKQEFTPNFTSIIIINISTEHNLKNLCLHIYREKDR